MTQLNLGNNLFTGALPNELSGMTSLVEASVEWNQITSNIHGAFNGISTLQSLFLARNLFHEQLSSDFLTNATGLFHLDLSDNKFGGTLPGHLLNLYLLDVQNNTFSGPLPDFWGVGDKLVYLAANNNFFDNTIPSAIAGLTDLIHLDLSNNLLSGAIPSEMGLLTNLQYVFLSGNTKFTNGAIPDLSNLRYLKALNLKNTIRTGPIPTYFGALTDLVVLDLSENYLTGTVPTDLTHLTQLGT
jgi:Leucine-rich repeat (LRR) protein